jgi:hypothetical protein
MSEPEFLNPQQVASKLPPMRGGKPVSSKTVRNWMEDGLAGVRLRWRPVGAQRVTTWKWVEAFFDEVQEAKKRAKLERQRALDDLLGTATVDKKGQEKARRELERLGAR